MATSSSTSQVEEILADLSEKTFRRSKSELFDPLQQVEALGHELNETKESEFVTVGALLFSQSFPHNALDFLAAALKSQELSKDLIEARARLYEALADFITRAGVLGVQDHVLRISQRVLEAVPSENHAKSKLACLRPFQAILELKTVRFPHEFDPVDTTRKVLDWYNYGKKDESFSPGVKGGLLTTAGLLCWKFADSLNQKTYQEKETYAKAVKRLSLYSLQKHKDGGGEAVLQAGALSCLRYVLLVAPCDTDSKEAEQVYACVKHGMTLTPDVKRFEAPFQAISLITIHANQLVAQIMKEPDMVFDTLRKCLHSNHDKLDKISMRACMAVLKTIAGALGGQFEEDRGDDVDVDDDIEEEDESALRSATRLKPVEMDEKLRKGILNMFMKRFSEFIQEGLKPPIENQDKKQRRAVKRDIDLAIHGFGLFAGVVMALMGESKLVPVLFKLFELSDRLDAFNEEQRETGESSGVELRMRYSAEMDRYEYVRFNEVTARRVRFLLTYARIAQYLSSTELDQERIMERFSREIISLATEYPGFPPLVAIKFTYSVEQLLAAMAQKGSSLQTLLSRIVLPIFVQSVSPASLKDQEEEFPFETFWRKLLPAAREPHAISNDERDGNKQTSNEPPVEIPTQETLSDDADHPSTTTTSTSTPTLTVKAVARSALAKQTFFDHFMSAVLKIIPKLNLECVISEQTEVLDTFQDQAEEKAAGKEEKRDKEDEVNIQMENMQETLSSSTAAMIHSTERVVPLAVDDLRMLHNITQLLLRLIPTSDPDQFLLSLPIFARMVADGAEKNPLLSTWYKLMSLAFQALDRPSVGTTVSSMDAQTKACLETFLETSAMRCKQYQDELLASSLSCVLQVPQGDLLTGHLKTLVPCMVMALRMGLSFAPIAVIALDQLERWIRCIPAEQLTVFYPIILPELGAYLSSQSGEAGNQSKGIGVARADETVGDEEQRITEGDDEDISRENKEMHRRFQSSLGKSQRAAMKKRQRWRESKKGSQKAEWDQIELRVVKILGRVGGYNRLVIPPLKVTLRSARRWSNTSQQVLSVTIPLGKFNFDDIYLDDVLPRVTTLARTSTDRQTKVAACELLHALVLVMVGRAKEKNSSDGFQKLYGHLLPELLKLAVDVEPVARQLFKPLIAQLARWFAREPAVSHERTDAAALLDASVEALGDESNGALRELAADTLAIFFRWTFKSAGVSSSSSKRTKVVVSDSINVDSLLQRLYALMRHPDPFKRLGSTLAFEAFYRDFREEAGVVNHHALQLLENGVIALRMADSDPEALGTTQAASEMLERMLRIVSHKAKELTIPDDSRMGFIDLSKALEWLFDLCASRETVLRARAQQLFEVLCLRTVTHPIQTDGERAKALHKWYLTHGKNSSVMKEAASTQEAIEASTVEIVFDELYLNQCAALVDFYWWLLRRSVVPDPAAVVNRAVDVMHKTSEKWLNSSTEQRILPPRAASAMCRLLRVYAAFTVTAEEFKMIKSDDDGRMDSVWDFLLLGLLKPRRFRIDSEHRDIKMFLPGVVSRMIGKSKEGHLRAETTLKRLYTQIPSLALAQLDLQSKSPEMACLLRGYITLCRSKVVLVKADRDLEVQQLANKVTALPLGSSPQSLRDGSSALRLCFELGWSVSAMVSTLLDTCVLTSSSPMGTDDSTEKATRGFTFFKHFQDEILSRLSEDLSATVPALLQSINGRNVTSDPRSSQAFQVLSALCDSVCFTQHQRQVNQLVDLVFPLLPVFVPSVAQGNDSAIPLVGKLLQGLAHVDKAKRDSMMSIGTDALKSLFSRPDMTIATKSVVIRHCLPPLLSGAVAPAMVFPGGARCGFFSKTSSTTYPVEVPSYERTIIESIVEKDVIVKHFPLTVKDLASKDVPSYLVLVDALFHVLENTGSVALLRSLTRVLQEYEAPVHAQLIQTSLRRLGERVDTTVHNQDGTDSMPCLDLLSECVRSIGADAPGSYKRSSLVLFQELLVPIGQRLSDKGWEVFLAEKRKIVSGHETVLGFLVAVVETGLESELSKHCAFTALQCFFESAGFDSVKQVQRAAYANNPEGNEATKLISKQANRILTEASKQAVHSKSEKLDPPSSTTISERVSGTAKEKDLVKALSVSERYWNAVYSCLVAVVCRTQSNPKFYDQLLFGNADLWHILLPVRKDASTEPQFAVVVPGAPDVGTKQRLGMAGILEGTSELAIQSSRRLTTGGGSTMGMGGTQIFTSLALEDEYISAPSPDSRKPQQQQQTTTVLSVQQLQSSTTETMTERETLCVADERVPLDMDALNSLPAMSALLTALDQVRRKKLFNVNEEEPLNVGPMPAWAKMVLEAIKDKRVSGHDLRQSLNIRLFGLRVVLNRPSLFDGFARVFTPAIVQLLLDLEWPYLPTADYASRGFHSFLKESIQLLLVWESRHRGSIRFSSQDLNAWNSASKLLEMLFQLAPDPAVSVMRNNVQLVTALMERWKSENLRVEGNKLVSLCRYTGSSKEDKSVPAKRSCALAILNAYEQLGDPFPVIPYGVPDASAFFDMVFENLRFNARAVAASAAEVLATSMARGHLTQYRERLWSLLEDLHRGTMVERWVEILATMIAIKGEELKEGLLTRELINRTLTTISQLEGDFLVMGMRIVKHAVVFNAKEVPGSDAYQAVLPVLDRGRVLSADNAHVASMLATVELLTAVTSKGGKESGTFLSLESLAQSQWFNLVLRLVYEHRASVVRSACLDYVGFVRDTHPQLQSSSSAASEVKRDLLQKLTSALIFGLSDPNVRIQKKMFEYWDHGERLPDVSPADRLLKALTEVQPFVHETIKLGGDASVRAVRRMQRSWGSHVVQLLLAMTRRSNEYDNPAGSLLFKDPLHQSSSSTSQIMEVGTDLMSQSAASSSLAPLFLSSHTQQQQQRHRQAASSSFSSQLVMATQSQSLDPDGGGMMIKATQQPQLEFAPTQQMGESGAPYRTTTASQQLVSSLLPPPPRLANAQGVSLKSSSSTMPPPSSSSSTTQQQSSSMTSGQGRRPQQQRQVVVLRKYRKGELPDIQIPLRDLTEPLIALCGLDAEVAKEVLKSFAKSILKRTLSPPSSSSSKPHPKIHMHLTPETFVPSINQSLSQLLDSASRSVEGADASFVSCVLSLVDLAASEGGSASEVSPKLIGEACRSSMAFADGINVLEALLLRIKDVAFVPQVKRSKLSRSSSSGNHVDALREEGRSQLFKLYESINETDVLLALAEQASRNSRTREALKLEFQQRFLDAKKTYDEVLANAESLDAIETSVAWMGKIKSLQALRQWRDVFNNTKIMVRDLQTRLAMEEGGEEEIDDEDDESRTNEAFFGKKMGDVVPKDLLSVFVSSGLRDTETRGDILRFLDVSFQDKTSAELLEARLSQELILAELLRPSRPEWARAEDRANRAIKAFVRAFSSQSVLATSTRAALIRPLQQLVEFLDVFESRRQCSLLSWKTTNPLMRVFKEWDRAMPSTATDGQEVWEATLTDRSVMVNAILAEAKGNAANRTLVASLAHKGSDHIVSLYKAGFESAVEQQALDIARAVLGQVKKAADDDDDESSGNTKDALRVLHRDLQIDYILAESRLGLMNEDRVQKLDKARKILLGQTPGGSRVQQANQQKRLARVNQEMVRFGGGDSREKASEALEAFEKWCNISSEGHSGEEIAAQYELGLFALQELERRHRQEGQDAGGKKAKRAEADDELLKVAVESMITAMRLGSEVASNSFPRLLTLVITRNEGKGATGSAAAADATRVFMNGLKTDIPIEVLLKWTSQLLSQVQRSDMVDEALLRLARTFPQSLVYPFRVSRQAIEERNTESNKGAISKRLDVIEKAMRLPAVVPRFIEALTSLEEPGMRLKDALKAIKSKLEVKDERGAFKIWREEVVDGVLSLHQDEKDVGRFNVSFANQVHPLVVPKGTEKTLPSLDRVKELLSKLFESGNSPLPKSNDASLKNYSGWLDSFAARPRRRMSEKAKGDDEEGNMNHDDDELEVPGWRDPDTSSLVREENLVKSFDSKLLKLSSLRSPKRLTMRTASGMARMFLVKGGEDLRLDERIEQLFTMMNRMMSKDHSCQSRELRVETYRVIPVSLRHGLIEWVPGTKPVLSVLQESVSVNDWKAADDQSDGVYAGGPKAYWDFYARPEEEFIEAYNRRVGKIPQGLLRHHLMNVATGPQAFLALRQTYSRSLAVASMCGYVLGIGDRHLDNFLMGPSCELIPIDFGYSFGIGVSLLPVPETAPMRFTPQLRQAMEPIGYKGEFFHSATAVMSLLRKERNQLLEVMDIFVNEPLVDWASHVRMVGSSKAASSSSSSSTGSGASDDVDTQRYMSLIKSRVRVAELKMKGCRPSLVMSAELRERKNPSREIEPVIQVLSKVAAGENESKDALKKKALNVRVDQESPSWEIATVPDQVEELIRMSVDPAILGRNWVHARHWL